MPESRVDVSDTTNIADRNNSRRSSDSQTYHVSSHAHAALLIFGYSPQVRASSLGLLSRRAPSLSSFAFSACSLSWSWPLCATPRAPLLFSWVSGGQPAAYSRVPPKGVLRSRKSTGRVVTDDACKSKLMGILFFFRKPKNQQKAATDTRWPRQPSEQSPPVTLECCCSSGCRPGRRQREYRQLKENYRKAVDKSVPPIHPLASCSLGQPEGRAPLLLQLKSQTSGAKQDEARVRR